MARFEEDELYTRIASNHMSTDSLYKINNDQWSHYPKDMERHTLWCVLFVTSNETYVVGTDLASEQDAFFLATKDASARGLEFDGIDASMVVKKLFSR